MSYRNGKDVLPDWLLKEIQRYVQRTSIYIPGNGEKPERKNSLRRRNEEIRGKYAGGTPVRALSEEYFLSTQAIYKILSGKR